MYKQIAEETRKHSFKREIYLDLLLKNLQDHKQGKGKNQLILGPQHIGKTHLLKEFICNNGNDLICLIDFNKTPMTPESIAISLITNVSSWHLKKDTTNLDKCKFGKKTAEIVDRIKNELQKIKPSQEMLAKWGFSFAEMLGKDLGIRTTICMDEYWRILDLNNFNQIKDINVLFKKTISEQEFVNYIATSSAVNLAKGLNKVLNFDIVEMKSLKLSDVGNDDVHYYSNGVPMYAKVLKKENTKESFLTESLWKSGIIYKSCELNLYDALSRARGKGLLLMILKTLSDNDGLRLSEISRKIFRSAAVTKNLINRLVEVDLLVKDSMRFTFNDSIMKFWFNNYINSNEFEEAPNKSQLENIEVNL